MKINTKYSGELMIAEEDIIHFKSGLPGFAGETQFIILDLAENPAMQILQSVQTASLAFIITNPHLYYPKYKFTLEQHVIDALAIEQKEDLAIVSILTLKEVVKDSTINLQAPIIINQKNKCAKQYILNHDMYSMRAKIAGIEESTEGEASC